METILHLFLNLLFIAFIVTMALLDFMTKRLPDKLTFTLFIMGLFNAGLSGIHTLILSLLTSLIVGSCFALMALVFRGGLGWGDVKFVAAIGAYLSFPYILFAIICSSLIGVIVGGILLLMHKINFRQQMPFGPYLGLGALISLFWGAKVCAWYLAFLLH